MVDRGEGGGLEAGPGVGKASGGEFGVVGAGDAEAGPGETVDDEEDFDVVGCGRGEDEEEGVAFGGLAEGALGGDDGHELAEVVAEAAGAFEVEAGGSLFETGPDLLVEDVVFAFEETDDLADDEHVGVAVGAADAGAEATAE